MSRVISLCGVHLSGNEQQFISEAFACNEVSCWGDNVNGFEEDLKHFVGGNNEVVALSAGTAAVHLALIACGVGPGDEVLVQSQSYDAENYKAAQSCQVRVNGRFVSLILSPKQADIAAIFRRVTSASATEIFASAAAFLRPMGV